jgi:ATP-dependent Lon protease
MTAQEKDNPKVNRRVAVPPGALMILPLRQTVLFPSTVMPLVVGRAPSLQVVEEAVRQQIQIGFVAQRDPSIEVPRPEHLYSVGTAADVLRMYSLPDGQRQIIIQGRQRFEVAEIVGTEPFLSASPGSKRTRPNPKNSRRASLICARRRAKP